MMDLRQLIFYRPDHRKGFTLVELMMALAVSAIILGAVVSFAFAIRSANGAFRETREKQAQVRYARLRISELIRHSKLICEVSQSAIALWRADDNGDGQINMGELVYIDRGVGHTQLRLIEFTGNNPVIDINQISPLITNWWLGLGVGSKSTDIIAQCSNVQFNIDASPPHTRFVSISFDLLEDGITLHYQISATLRSRPDNLLDKHDNMK